MINAALFAETRVRRGLSQRKLAYLAGLNYQVIRRIEAGGDDGNLTLRHLARVCEALQLPPAELLTAVSASTPSEVSGHELSIAQARLLRRIQRGEDVRRSLSATERELTLPSLARRGLVSSNSGSPFRLSGDAAFDLTP